MENSLDEGINSLFLLFVGGSILWIVLSVLVVYAKIKFQQYVVKEKSKRIKLQHQMRKGKDNIKSKGSKRSKSLSFSESTDNLPQDKYYELAKTTFNSAMKNGQMKREEIIGLSELLDKMLSCASKKYDKYYFKNDCHKIYVQLKDGNLGQLEYQKIIDYISSSKGIKEN